MNNLGWIRNQSGLTLKQVGTYTGMPHPSLVRLEKEERPFRQNHINLLCSFFQVTSDFLLGNSDKGIIMVNWDAEHVIFSREQLVNATGHYKQIIAKDTLAALKNSSQTNGAKTIAEWFITRSLDEGYVETGQAKIDKAIEDLKKMNDEQLDQSIKFMEEFILKKKT